MNAKQRKLKKKMKLILHNKKIKRQKTQQIPKKIKEKRIKSKK